MRKLLLAIILSLFAFQSVQAATGWKRFDFFNNAGGLNNAFGPIAVADNEAADLQNVVLATGQNFKTRSGFTNINSATIGANTDCNGLIYYKQADADEFLVAVFSDDTVRKMDYSGGDPDGTWDDVTGGLSFSVTQNDLASFAIGEDVVFFTDGLGTNGIYEWTGTGNATSVANSPDSKYVLYHKRMAFSAGDTSNPSLLYFTDLGDISNWSTGLSGNVSVDETDGSIIRGLNKLGDNLYIFTDSSIWRLSGTDKDSFILKRMISGIGTLSHHCITQVIGQLAFMSQEADVYIYNGGFGLENISPKIEGTTDGMNQARLSKTVGVFYDGDYYLAYSDSGSTGNDQVLVFDTFHLAWTKFDGMNINGATVGNISDGTEALFFGGYDGFVNQYPDGTSDAGTAINVYYLTKQYRFPELTTEKFLRLLKVYAAQEGSYNLEVEVLSDFESTGETTSISLEAGGSLWDVAVWDVDAWAGENLVTGRIELDKGNEFFQIRFSNENLDQPFEVKGWSMFLEPSENI